MLSDTFESKVANIKVLRDDVLSLQDTVSGLGREMQAVRDDVARVLDHVMSLNGGNADADSDDEAHAVSGA